MKLSLILSTYNRPDALKLVIEALNQQTDRNFEIVIADDGSDAKTKTVIDEFSQMFTHKIIHAWQEDMGFRLSASRNNAIRRSSGDYLVFLDGDCIPNPNFIKNHKKLAEPGYFVTGNRILLSEPFTKKILLDGHFDYPSIFNFFLLKTAGKINKFLPSIDLTMINQLRKLSPCKWQRLRGCNFAAWRRDVFDINGFDENFQGWGFEDSDFAVRLINNGVRRKSGHFSTTVLHLYHPEGNKAKSGPSWNTLMERIKGKEHACEKGLIIR